jgi:hypothetical protein
MDPYVHTLIAIALMMASYYAGKFFGKEEGVLHVWGMIMEAVDAKEIEINEDGEIIVTYDDGSEETLN